MKHKTLIMLIVMMFVSAAWSQWQSQGSQFEDLKDISGELERQQENTRDVEEYRVPHPIEETFKPVTDELEKDN